MAHETNGVQQKWDIYPFIESKNKNKIKEEINTYKKEPKYRWDQENANRNEAKLQRLYEQKNLLLTITNPTLLTITITARQTLIIDAYKVYEYILEEPG